MAYTTIITEGGLLPADILDAIAGEELTGQRPEDFGLERGRNLSDRIAAAWQAARGHWMLFKTYVDDLRESEPGTSVTRQRWVLPLLDVLGYQLAFNQGAYQVEGRSYAISHRAGQHDDAPPVHVEGIRTSLDARPPSGRPRLSPHALLQEYLNSTEHLWGIVTNGERLRLLRDSSRFTRPAYVEFDLRAMFEGEKFSEFALLYRLIHRSRLPQDSTDTASCLLEKYHQQAVETGGRVREKLRDGVELALRTLGSGLLEHPANAELRAKLEAGKLTPLVYYRQLLKLVYRLLFLMVAEDRGLIATGTRRLTAADDDPFEITSTQSFDALLASLVRGPSVTDRLRIYYNHYSVARLRRMAEAPGAGRGPYDDLWMGLQTTFRLLEGSDEQSPRSLGLAPLDGDLFGPDAIADLEGQRLRNADLLRAIRALSLYREKESKALRRVNYGALDVEELGSVYESLLDFRPVVSVGTSERSNVLTFELVTGTERKTTGSYYTRPELVQELIKSALVPVIEDRLRAATTDHRQPTTAGASGDQSSVVSRRSSAQEEAILAIRVCDPACGSGHFLLAAARRLGRELAKVRSGEDQPTPAIFRRAVRDVIQHCIYGVDLNPLAVDLCKLALWIEGHNAGMPLSFLDHHIKQGNSLIGGTRALVAQGIPDDAYKAVTGDDKATASSIRKRNKAERELQQRHGMAQATLFDAPADRGPTLAEQLDTLDATVDDSVAAVRAKAARYRRLQAQAAAERARFDMWTAAFFQPLTPDNARNVPTTRDLLDARVGDIKAIQAEALAREAGFFHWELEFPQVFEATTDNRRLTTAKSDGGRSSAVGGRTAGFDVVLGNPPWERIKLQEQEHWVDVPEVRDAANKAAREKVIQAWRASADPIRQARVAEFDSAKYRAEAESRFVRASQRFPLTAVGDVNTYALFAEHARDLLAPTGRAGIIVPTGIATDSSTSAFFSSLIERKQLAQLIGFENEALIFADVHHAFKFSTLTIVAGGAEQATFVFFIRYFSQIGEAQRQFSLMSKDITLINPNTHTAPIFRTSVDAELTKKIYRHVPVLLDERNNKNLWAVQFTTMFHMSGDSGLFRDTNQDSVLPLYEAKMFSGYDHRFASTIKDNENTFRQNQAQESDVNNKKDPSFGIRYIWYVDEDECKERMKRWGRKWLVVYKDITASIGERTCIVSFLPFAGVGHTAPIFIFKKETGSYLVCSFVALCNSLIFDYLTRQKMGGLHLTYTVFNQLPVLPPSAFSADDIAFIVPRVLELVYTAWDMRPFAEDVWGEAGDGRLGMGDGDRAANRGAGGGGGGGGGIGIGGGNGGIDVGAKHSPRSTHADSGLRANASPLRHPSDASGASGASPASPARSGAPGALAALQTEILRRNAECNADAPPELFSPRDGFPLPPFRWDDTRRAHIRAELDARIARLYGLTRDELRYILDPADVYGPDFPGETFRVLKEKETKLYGEYRTRRLVLEAWDRENPR